MTVSPAGKSNYHYSVLVKVIDNDKDEITVVHRADGQLIRSWNYIGEIDRRLFMRHAREFAEGWFQAMKHMDDTA
jgi:hypothetical protein